MAIAKPNPQAFAVFVATFVATSVFAVAMLSRVASMAPGATPLGATSEKLGLAWIDGAMFCGDWPTPAEIAPIAKIMATVTGEPVAQGCAGASKTIIAKNKHMDAAACAAWCPTAAPGGMSDWCCTFTETLTAHGTADACTVSDGVATMIPSTSALVTTQAFSTCGPPPGMLGASNTYEEYPCPEKKMQNALNFGEDGCSQICLPHAFFGIAQGHGVRHGRCCEDHGYCEYKFSNSQSGVHYNVYNKAGETYVMPDWPPPRE